MKYIIFILLCLSLAFIPSLGSADIAPTQWLYLSIVILCVFIYLFILDKFQINFYYKVPSLKLYYFFIFFSFLSLTYTNNFIISIHELSHLSILLLLLVILINLTFEISLNFTQIAFCFFAVGICESLFSLSPILYSIYNDGLIFLKSTSLNIDIFKGVAGNRNITTASLIVKIPFSLYLVYILKGYKRILISTLIILFLLPIFLISSRTALLSLLVIVLLNCIYLIYNRSLKQLFVGIYLLVPILFSYFLSVLILPSNNKKAIDRISSIEVTNESSSNRFELWSNALDYISNNFFIGSGIGNWKVDSAAYWGSLGADYLVPYHAHNDFLHYTTELGIIGGILYLSIFISLFYICFVLFKKQHLISFTLFCSLGVFFIDSCLNFPYDRPIMQVSFIILITLISYYYKFYINEK